MSISEKRRCLEIGRSYVIEEAFGHVARLVFLLATSSEFFRQNLDFKSIFGASFDDQLLHEKKDQSDQEFRNKFQNMGSMSHWAFFVISMNITKTSYTYCSQYQRGSKSIFYSTFHALLMGKSQKY
jgi:hypothetical protein